MLDICRACEFSMTKVIIDHCTDANIGMALEAGANAAISVQPWRNVTPDMAADIIIEHGFERVMIDSDASGLPSDPLAVPKTAMAMKKKGVSEENIEKVCFLNSKQVYGI
jgi:predicted metal-dependent TIM-barrel fold hydrolase